MTPVTPSSSLSDGGDAIVIADLVKRFEGQNVDAVASIHTSISRGTITGLVGPDGAGKTTFLRLLCRFVYNLLRVVSASMASIRLHKVMSCMSTSAICHKNSVCTKI